MIFTLFTVIIFIAELIIAFTLIWNLCKIDKIIIGVNDFLVEANPKIKEIVVLVRNISEQIYELSPNLGKKLEGLRNQIILWKFKNFVFSFLFLLVNIKIIKKMKHGKMLKLAIKGLSMIQNMV